MFNPKRVLILSKITRYEFEGSVIGVSDEQQIRSALKRKGLNVDALLARHQVHHEKLSEFRKQLSARGVDVQVVDRLGYTADAVNWADVIFTAGGDGTFLLGAHKIRTRDKLIIGLNTDPDLPLWRNRIRVTLIHDKQHVPRIDVLDKRKPAALDGWDRLEADEFQQLDESCRPQVNPPSSTSGVPLDSLVPAGLRKYMTQTTLPIRALNEVFFGESLSAKVSHYDISIDGEKYVRQKSSGVTCATGTGSSSWFYQINRLSTEVVADVLAIAKRLWDEDKRTLREQLELHSPHGQPVSVRSYSVRGYPAVVPVTSESRSLEELQGCIPSLAHSVADQYNASIPIRAEDLRIAYVVRDPLCNAVFNVSRPRGLATQIQIRSTMLGGQIVFDGGWLFPLHYGAVVDLSISPSDALCCLLPVDSS
ncbi:NAD kinase 2 mitochondrial [Fasciola hepatica]|uniref:NAD kinase 2 mitochondrial n=1 Tax=Fasciola hepatica TaxID=6192 RepID=A0A4E0RE77_FASHE|nr:NAD kinase 2 mitochondrial [Fasciola hepatica]